MIKRKLQAVIEKNLFKGKAIIVVGARQVGKSTLLQQILDNSQANAIVLNCDEPEVNESLAHINTPELKLLIASNRIVVIDEAQRVPGIGLALKRIIDNFPDVQLLVSGSSSLQLRDSLNEPLTGRKYEYFLYPFSSAELFSHSGLLSVKQALEPRLIFGSYPDVINHPGEARELILNIADSYLYKDILALDNLRRPVLLNKLLTVLALQVGSEVSYNEIAQTIGSDSKTVEKYIDLLEKCFVVFRLNGFNRNMRTELKKSKKVYFYDNGVRNAVLQNFAPLALRQDAGALWENFFICERIKANQYSRRFVRSYFWRTTQQQEIDYIEESDGKFTIFEMKWNPKKAKKSFPKSFLATYPVADSAVITPENYLNYLDIE
jgi:predicted AAA+ superfamily ATPase